MGQQPSQPQQQLPPAQRLPDGSTTDLTNLNNIRNVIDSNYDYISAYWRAVKVWHISYPEKDHNSPPNYNQHMNEFLIEMHRLFSGPTTMTRANLDSVMQHIRSDSLSICVTIKRFDGRHRLSNPKVLIIHQGQNYTLKLDPSKEVQPVASFNNPTYIQTNITILGNLRRDPNKALIIKLQGTNWLAPDEHLNEFTLDYGRTHPEGYEDWFNFGRGVRLLINVEYVVTNEPNVTPTQASDFHLHTIYKMLQRRLQEYGARTRWTQLGHRQIAYKTKVTHRQPFVDPKTNGMFWSTPNTGMNLIPDATRPQRRSIFVKFVDFQRGYKSNEDFEDNVCLCSEWCNWNAFFYYNPIYRFLMVRHSQLYMKERYNLPSMYLSLSILAGDTPNPQNTPILHLMISANDYRQKYYEKYYLMDPKMKDDYKNNVPKGSHLNAVAYNKLRDVFDITVMCHRLDANPFADICIEALIDFFKVLTDLHVTQTLTHRFIYDRKEWYRQMDVVGRDQYCEYLTDGCKKAIQTYGGGYDYLFTPDYEYATRMAITRGEVQLKQIRDKVLKKLFTESPFNIQITANNFLNALTSVSKFFSKVEPMLPVAHRHGALKKTVDCYVEIDVNLENLCLNNSLFSFGINSIDPRFQNFEQNFHAFYTLKLYFYLFEIQKHCITTSTKMNRRLEYPSFQISTEFMFIWRNSMVEQKFVNTYNGEFLFETIPNFVNVFTEFYQQFWGRAHHELNPTQRLKENIDSGLTQYLRLYFWLRNNGNNRRKFAKIIELFTNFVTNSENRSQVLLTNWMIEPIELLRQSGYTYNLEVFDQLVYYLVKANCSVILSTTAKFFQQMHNLQIPQLVTNLVSYSMSKPGWVPLFQTMYSVFDTIDELKRNNIEFEDEFEHITNTCNKTKTMVKDIYRQFYTNLCRQWTREIVNCLVRLNGDYANGAKFIEMQLAVGQAFMGAFADDFRFAFFQFRGYVLRFLRAPMIRTFVQNIRFRMCRQVFQNYFRDRNAMRTALPFQSNQWRAHLAQTFAQLDTLTGQQVQVDLNVANV